ncbi:hypothetical protein STVA_29100 [Allostella vacuolata]|nr:hypothetical protein STVA_29100 [Stella vacuolata]
MLLGLGLGIALSAAGVLGWLAWKDGDAEQAELRPPAAMPPLKPALPDLQPAPPVSASLVQAPAGTAPPPALLPAPSSPPGGEAPAVHPPAVHAPRGTAATVAALPAVPSHPAPPGVPAWRRNAVQVAPAPAGVPRIAIVIDDLGPNQRGSQAIIALRGPLTLAFLPYAGDVSRMVDTARRGGHEILVHMPMEPLSSTVDPGPQALLLHLTNAELRRRIEENVTRFPGHVGLNNHMGSRFTADSRAMGVLMDEIAGRGLMFLDSRTTVDTVAEGLARARSIPFVSRDVFLDNDQAADKVDHQLLETERIARRKGQAVAIGHPHAATRDALAQWLPQAVRRGFQIVPISSLARIQPTEQARQ